MTGGQGCDSQGTGGSGEDGKFFIFIFYLWFPPQRNNTGVEMWFAIRILAPLDAGCPNQNTNRIQYGHDGNFKTELN